MGRDDQKSGAWAGDDHLRNITGNSLARWKRRLGAPGPTERGEQPELTASEAEQLHALAMQRGAKPLALLLQQVGQAARTAGSAQPLRDALQNLTAFAHGEPAPGASLAPQVDAPRPVASRFDPNLSLMEPPMLSRSVFAGPGAVALPSAASPADVSPTKGSPGPGLPAAGFSAPASPGGPSPLPGASPPTMMSIEHPSPAFRAPAAPPARPASPSALPASPFSHPLPLSVPAPRIQEKPPPVGSVLGLRAKFSRGPTGGSEPPAERMLGLGQRRRSEPGMDVPSPEWPSPQAAPPALAGSESSDRRATTRRKRRNAEPGTRTPIPIWLPVIAGALLGLGAITVYVIVSASRPGDVPPPPSPTATPAPLAGNGSARPADTDRAPERTASSSFPQPPPLSPGSPGKESAELTKLLEMQRRLVAACQTDSNMCGGRWTPLARDALGAADQAPLTILPTPGSSVPPGWVHKYRVPKELVLHDEPAVRTRFDYLNNIAGHQQFQSMLFECAAYADIFESALEKYGAPSWLRAVVFQESQCSPRAKSPVGALGLWQFMPESAQAYGLRVDERVDERLNPMKETEAAVHFLVDLYRALGGWDLVLAAYNMGPFAVLRQLNRAPSGTGFWDLVHAGVIPEETAGYVPAIEAYALATQNLSALHFTMDGKRLEATAQIPVRSGTRLSLIARAASTSTTRIRDLNPEFLVDVIPEGAFFVRVPDGQGTRAQAFLEQLAPGDEIDRCVPDTFDWGATRFEASPYAANCASAR